jgi:hypothetical protein
MKGRGGYRTPGAASLSPGRTLSHGSLPSASHVLEPWAGPIAPLMTGLQPQQRAASKMMTQFLINEHEHTPRKLRAVWEGRNPEEVLTRKINQGTHFFKKDWRNFYACFKAHFALCHALFVIRLYNSCHWIFTVYSHN